MTEVFIGKTSPVNIDGTYPETMLNPFWERGTEHIHTVTVLPHFSTGPRDSNLDPRTRKEDEALNGDLKCSESHPTTRPADASESPLNDDLSSDLAVQVRLEKETWLNVVYLFWGPCGYLLRRKPPVSLIDGKPETVGTLFLAPPRFCPTTFPMPSGSTSPGAIALTSLHYNALEVDDDMLRVLIVTALHKSTLCGTSAVEALGYSGTTDSMSALTPSPPTPDDGTENLIADFEAQLEEKLNPKSCVSDSLAAINHNAGDLTCTWTLLDPGFRVVTPHPTHPKFRIELNVELDWDGEIGRVSDLSVRESFMCSELFSL